ncbi:hypothetical protein [Pseudomonas brassicacearum]|uniref:hypothetical protein n=1 Tax=Pseudomonas brassicacearum TaxID=930166 RepID=UPI001E594C3B|nr:hypothetical protein [Pseudomonas brassicacearum]
MGPLNRPKKPGAPQFFEKKQEGLSRENPQGSSFDRNALIRRVFLQDLANQLN